MLKRLTSGSFSSRT